MRLTRLSLYRGEPEPKRFHHALQLRGDDSLQGAIANVSPNGGAVRLAPDEWTLGKSVTISNPVTLIGSGSNTVVNADPGAGTPLIDITSSGGVTLRDIKFVSTAATPRTAIRISADNVQIMNCTFSGFTTAIEVVSGKKSWRIEGCDISGQAGQAIDVNGGRAGSVSNNIITAIDSFDEMEFDAASAGCVIMGNIIDGGSIKVTGASGHVVGTTNTLNSATVTVI